MIKLTLITISKIKHNNRTFFIEPKITIYPKFNNETKEYYSGKLECFDFSINGNSLKELLDDFANKLNFILEAYVLCDDSNFTYENLEIREKLENRVFVEEI